MNRWRKWAIVPEMDGLIRSDLRAGIIYRPSFRWAHHVWSRMERKRQCLRNGYGFRWVVISIDNPDLPRRNHAR